MREQPKQGKVAATAVRRANLVVLRGTVDGAIEERVLGSGERVSALEVRVAGGGAGGGLVPVVWHDAPAVVHELHEEEVLVVGWVRRRFFRSAGGVQSRTEVVAESVTPTRRSAKLRAALVDAAARLAELA